MKNLSWRFDRQDADKIMKSMRQWSQLNAAQLTKFKMNEKDKRETERKRAETRKGGRKRKRQRQEKRKQKKKTSERD